MKMSLQIVIFHFHSIFYYLLLFSVEMYNNNLSHWNKKSTFEKMHIFLSCPPEFLILLFNPNITGL